jgi:predicted NUDIX family phosphoesterase
MKHQEHILAIDANCIETKGSDLQMISVEIPSSEVIIGQRKKLEQDPRFRQIIPYVCLMHDGKIAAYTRTAKGGESRLHGKLSCGFGGHVDLADIEFDADNSVVDLTRTVKRAATREMFEEIDLGFEVKESDIEILEQKIVSSESDVDAVHIGLVAIINVTSEQITSKEDQLNIVGFLTAAEILEYPEIENWTRGLVEFLSKR